MNRDEAKYILRAYHLGGQDADDPQFREALEMLRRDPVLAEWFAQEQTLDTKLSEKFLSFPVPPDLKAQLLAARKVMPLRSWWARPAWIAAAACLMLMATVAVMLMRPAGKPQFAAFRNYVADTTVKLDRLDVMSKNMTELRQWLQNRGAPGDFVVPASLNGHPSIGCRVFDWRGQHVSLVCFNLDNGQVVHLFVIDRATLRDVPAGTSAEFAMMNGGTATASWSNDKCVYVLAGHKVDEQELRKLL